MTSSVSGVMPLSRTNLSRSAIVYVPKNVQTFLLRFAEIGAVECCRQSEVFDLRCCLSPKKRVEPAFGLSHCRSLVHFAVEEFRRDLAQVGGCFRSRRGKHHRLAQVD